MRSLTMAIILIVIVALFVALIVVILNTSNYEYVISLAVSLFAFVFAALSYFYRTSPSISSRFDTQVVSSIRASNPATLGTQLNYGGTEPLLPGEGYLDLIIINGGPGVAREVMWCLEIIGYMENESALNGAISVLESQGKMNVQGFLKIYHVNRDRIVDQYKKDHNIHGEVKLLNEQVKEVQGKSNSIEKYCVHLSYKSFLTSKRRWFRLSFNEDGGYIKQEICKCDLRKQTEGIQDPLLAYISRISRTSILAEGISNVMIAAITVIIGLYYAVPHYFGWIAISVIILNFILGGVLLSAYPSEGLNRWVRVVRKFAKKREWMRHQSSTFVFMLLLGSFGIAVALSNISVGLERFEFTKPDIIRLIIVMILAIVTIGLGLMSSSTPKRNDSKELTPVGFILNVTLILGIIIGLFSLVLYAVRLLSEPTFYITVTALLVSIFLGSDTISREFSRKA